MRSRRLCQRCQTRMDKQRQASMFVHMRSSRKKLGTAEDPQQMVGIFDKITADICYLLLNVGKLYIF